MKTTTAANFSSLSPSDQGLVIEAMLDRCGRRLTHRWYFTALDAAASIDAEVALNRVTVNDLSRAQLHDLAADVRREIADLTAYAAELRMAVEYYRPGAQEIYARHRRNQAA